MKPITSKTDRETKWRMTYDRFSGWNTDDQKQVQQAEAEVMARWLLDLQLPSYDILEVGCGNGYFGKVLIEKLIEADVSFTYHFTDFLPECIEQAKRLMEDSGKQAGVSFSIVDVYEIDTVLPAESQSIILSTGFVSPVTYKDALPKVARVLQKDGILICDFVNHLSPLVFLSRPLASIQKLINILQQGRGKKNDVLQEYHFGLIGIRRFYQMFGLKLQRCRTIRFRQNPLICMFKKQ